jgi:hypothetical protein
MSRGKSARGGRRLAAVEDETVDAAVSFSV